MIVFLSRSRISDHVYPSRVAHTVRVHCGCAICPVVGLTRRRKRSAWCGRFTAGAATLSWSAERALRKENGSGSKFAGALKEIELAVNLGIGTPGKSGSGGGGSESPVVSRNCLLSSQLAKSEYRHSRWAAQCGTSESASRLLKRERG